MNLSGKKLHFMGIGGIGVSALAEMAKAEGAFVSGCDREAGEVTRALEERGIAVSIGHNPGHMDGQDLLVHTSAVPPEHPERRAACNRQVKRGQFLAELMEGRGGIGVSGTHGKTTTSWLLSHLLIEADQDPAVFIGGIVPDLEFGNYRIGKGRFVAELDESDESFLLPNLDIAVATNLESDHLSHYRDYETLKAAFGRYAKGVERSGLFMAGVDSPDLAALYSAHPGRKMSFGLDEEAEVRAENIEFECGRTRFDLSLRGERLGQYALSLPGRHNVLNALAAIGAAMAVGVDAETIRAALPGACGVGRRLELIGEAGTTALYTDYAHHPTEVAATIAALRQARPGRILAVFQPHLYTRTRDYADAFGLALAAADEVLLVDIYPAREDPIPGVTSALLLEPAKRINANVAGPLTLDRVADAVRARAGEFDTVVFMGAGDIDRVAREVAGC